MYIIHCGAHTQGLES